MINNVQCIRAMFIYFFAKKGSISHQLWVRINYCDFQLTDFNDVRLSKNFGRFFQKLLKIVIANRWPRYVQPVDCSVIDRGFEDILKAYNTLLIIRYLYILHFIE